MSCEPTSQNMTANSLPNDGQGIAASPEFKSIEKNGVNKPGQPSDIYQYSSLKKTLKKSQSSGSLGVVDLNFQNNCSSFTQQGSPQPLSRESLVAKGNGRTTIGYEPGFRDRIPSFTVRRPPIASELQTHFAVYKFVARHNDELALSVGDAIYVKRVHEDLWCEGRNLRTGEYGIFPSRYVSDILSHAGTKFEFSDNGVQFFLRFLGSVEVFEFKGNTLLCQAISKILSIRSNSKVSEVPPCSLEIDYKGIRLIDHAQEIEAKRLAKSFVGRLFNNEQKVSNVKYFFNLKDVTFCGCYPNSPRYFGFVTKHPSDHRFACHTFMSEFSTEPVARAIGQAFKRFSAEVMHHRSSSR